jgi:hypothetical protein
MVDLAIQIFENYTLQDVLGEAPPADSKLRQSLESEVSSMITKLNDTPKPELEKILSQHLKAKQEMTKFSGAMALNQDKLEMFHEFLSKYISAIKSQLNCL